MMLKRYFELKSNIVDLYIPAFNAIILSYAVHNKLSELLDKLTILESVNKNLQSKDTTISDFRALF